MLPRMGAVSGCRLTGLCRENGSSSRRAIIEALEADAAERGIPMRLYGLDRPAVEEIETLFPGKYGFSANRDGFDYLYEIERLAELDVRGCGCGTGEMEGDIR